MILVCFGGGPPWQSLWVGVWQICWGERGKQPHWSQSTSPPTSSTTHTPSQKKSKSPCLAGYSTAWWRSETWYTWTNRDLISPRLPTEEAWQRLKKLYIPPSVTGQQGQTPHLSLAVILLSNTSHRPQSIGGKLASLLFSSEKTPRKFICIYQDLVYTRG